MISSELQSKITTSNATWLVTGVSGFIGSNLLESLLKLNQKVIGLDNFSTGKRHNLEGVQGVVAAEQWSNFEFHEGDIRDLDVCHTLCSKADYILHQAALGSVNRSVNNPTETNSVNVGGFLNMLVAAQKASIKRFVFASSSSVYGDNQDLPKQEEKLGKPLSPYAASKFMTEMYSGVYASLHGFASVGLRYFNVFGPRQDPNGDYAAVIPRWISYLLAGTECQIFGDGKTSRDFCYVANVVEANLRAALSDPSEVGTQCLLNVGNSNTTTLLELYQLIVEEVKKQTGKVNPEQPKFADFRKGDVRHSLASIEKAQKLLRYDPQYDIKRGISETVAWFLKDKN